MSNVGTQLRQAREARRKTRADVAGETGILVHHLAALEHGSFDTLPDNETVAGFVKVYAEYLGFVADEPVAEFWAERGAEPPVSIEIDAPHTDPEASTDSVVPHKEPVVSHDAAVEQPEAVASTGPDDAIAESPVDVRREVASDPPIESHPVEVANEPAIQDAVPDERSFRWRWIAVGGIAVVLVVLWFATRSGPDPVAEEAAVSQPIAPVQTEAPPQPDDPEEGRTPAIVQTEPEASPPPPEPASVGAGTAEPPVDVRESTSGPAAETPTSTLRISRHALGIAVEGNELVGPADRFEVGQRVWFWNRITDGRGERIYHVWIHEGREISRVELEIGSASWRTWSVKTMFGGSAGNWTVEARNADDRLLARNTFVCEP